MRIVVLAGGSDQIALIDELKRRGHYVILVDYYDNPPAKLFSDKHIVASTLDLERVKDIVLDEQADLVCTACTDQALLTVAMVSEQLNMPCYLSYKTALNVTNKSYMKRMMIENGISTSRYIIVKEYDKSDFVNLNFPLVVKPVDCNSSKGVKLALSYLDLELYIKEALLLSRTKTAIVEEFKKGKEISADFYIENGVAKLLSATSSQKIKYQNSFTIISSDYPSVSLQQEIQLELIATDIARVFNLTNSPLLIQLILENDIFYVLEFSARMGGGSKYSLIRTLSGVNIMNKYVELVLGGQPTVCPVKSDRYHRMIYVYSKPGIFDHVMGLEELYNERVIDQYFVYKTKGMKIFASETSSDRSAGYLVSASTEQELMRKIEIVDSRIQVISDEGVDIMKHKLYL